MKAGIGICYFTSNPLKDFYMGTAQLNGFKFCVLQMSQLTHAVGMS